MPSSTVDLMLIQVTGAMVLCMAIILFLWIADVRRWRPFTAHVSARELFEHPLRVWEQLAAQRIAPATPTSPAVAAIFTAPRPALAATAGEGTATVRCATRERREAAVTARRRAAAPCIAHRAAATPERPARPVFRVFERMEDALDALMEPELLNEIALEQSAR
jgi:hypothetical protein